LTNFHENFDIGYTFDKGKPEAMEQRKKQRKETGEETEEI
jgi:hypothetical protein